MKDVIARFRDMFRGDRILIPLLLLAFFIRIWGLGADPFFDEVIWVDPVKEILGGSPFYTNWIPHPPLSVLFFSFFALLGGVSFHTLRMMPLFTGLLTIIVSYFFAKSLYGRKVAILSALLMSIIFYHVWMSLWIDSDGSVLTLFCLMTLFCFHKFERAGNRKWMALTGIFLGLSILSKYPAVLLVPILLLYDWFSNRLGNLRPILLSVLIGIAVFSVFPITIFMLNSPEIFLETLMWGSGNLGRSDVGNIFYSYALSMGKLVVFLFQYGTPILCLAPLYSIWRRERKDNILFIYIAVILLFFTFVIMGGPKARYIMPAVPLIVMLASKNMLAFSGRLNRHNLLVFASLFAVSLLLIVSLNTYGVKETFNSKNMGLGLVAENSLFWYSGFASYPFAIRIHPFLFVVSASVILFLLSLRYGKLPLIAIVSVSLAFNSVILVQSFNPTFGPNLKNTVTEMTEYYRESGMECDLYAAEKVFSYYSSDIKYVDLAQETRVVGCLFAVDVQGMTNTELFREATGNCIVIEKFYSNGFEFGYIYDCR